MAVFAPKMLAPSPYAARDGLADTATAAACVAANASIRRGGRWRLRLRGAPAIRCVGGYGPESKHHPSNPSACFTPTCAAAPPSLGMDKRRGHPCLPAAATATGMVTALSPHRHVPSQLLARQPPAPHSLWERSWDPLSGAQPDTTAPGVRGTFPARYCDRCTAYDPPSALRSLTVRRRNPEDAVGDQARWDHLRALQRTRKGRVVPDERIDTRGTC